MAKTKNTTHFGFKNVPVDEKESLVGGVFSNVAKNYDIMNDFMSAGIHRLWKNTFVRRIAHSPSKDYLDVAGGTGDIAERILKRVRPNSLTLSDINPHMLDEGEKRATNRGLTYPIKWVEGNAENLPFKDNSFDVYTIAFGLRNVTRIDAVLKDAYRVLKPGGQFLCLEFSKVVNPTLAKLYDVYSFNIIPKIGEIVASDHDAYQYLVESIRKFPDQQTLLEKMQNAGMQNCTYENLTHGVVAIHQGWKV